jgi:hypothetical protein
MVPKRIPVKSSARRSAEASPAFSGGGVRETAPSPDLALASLFQQTHASLEAAEAVLRGLSVSRLEELRSTLACAASGLRTLRAAAAASPPEERATPPLRSAAKRLAASNRRVQRLYAAAADFHAALLRARCVEETGYGTALPGGQGPVGLWLPPAPQFKTVG